MPKIKYENRAVAFVDVLGFKALVASSQTSRAALGQVQSLVNLLGTAIPALNAGVSSNVPSKLFPRHLYVSDCIILSAPLSVSHPDWRQYNGLEILVMRVIQITHMVTDAGYLVRGGISIGKVWHGKSNIVGPAYQEAYQLEACTGMPRVELSAGARSHWNSGFCATSRMCVDYNGHFMVNGFHDFYVQNGMPARDALLKYRQSAVCNASNSALGSGQQKWQWHLSYLDQELARTP